MTWVSPFVSSGALGLLGGKDAEATCGEVQHLGQAELAAQGVPWLSTATISAGEQAAVLGSLL